MRLLCILLVCFYCSAIPLTGMAGAPAPSQRLEAEKKAFMESQISAEHKLFLDTLGERLKNLAELNGAASRMFATVTAYEASQHDTENIFKKQSHQALSLLFGPRKPVANLKQFSLSYFSTNEITSLLDEITNSYERGLNISQNIDAYSQAIGLSDGSFYYFRIRLNSFEKAFDESIVTVLENASCKYIQLYPLTKAHDIKQLYAESGVLSEYFKEAESLLQKELIEPLRVANQTWSNAVLIAATELIDKHYQLNYAFAESVKQVLADIKIPRQPQLADLIVPSIEIILPHKVKRGGRVRINAQIKNVGELTSELSSALLRLPDSRKITFRIPRLAPNEIYTIGALYTLGSHSENTFLVTANYNQKAPEADYENNSTKRSLILPVE